MLDEEESTEQIVAKAVPSYLWKVADYIDSVGTWQGTATELLSAADIEGVLPHQLTRKNRGTLRCGVHPKRHPL